VGARVDKKVEASSACHTEALRRAGREFVRRTL